MQSSDPAVVMGDSKNSLQVPSTNTRARERNVQISVDVGNNLMCRKYLLKIYAVSIIIIFVVDL